MKIVFYPPPDGTNQYTAQIAQVLALSGFELQWFSFKALITGQYRNCVYFQMNWFETCSLLKSFLYRLFVLSLLRLGNKKIVFVMHNKQAHSEGTRISQVYSGALARILFKNAYRIVVHSRDSPRYMKELYHRKTVYIPHPSYVDVYGPIVRDESPPGSALRLLFFGQIRPYKNIEVLIDSVSRFSPEAVFLTIAGKAHSPQYAGKLRDKIEGRSNIEARFCFFEDAAIPGLLSQCDMLVLPYDLRSSLNSGSALLAFSYKKTVIASETGTIKDMGTGFFLSYTYTDEREHIVRLTEAIDRAVVMKKTNPNIFVQWGEAMYRDMLQNNDPGKIADDFKQLYAR
jgi:glycosyltransferase involved in cell wall biosynthesis